MNNIFLPKLTKSFKIHVQKLKVKHSVLHILQNKDHFPCSPTRELHARTLGHRRTKYSPPATGATIRVKGTTVCTARNEIHLIRCPCGLTYVGETQLLLKTRAADQRSWFSKYDQQSLVAPHFWKANPPH